MIYITLDFILKKQTHIKININRTFVNWYSTMLIFDMVKHLDKSYQMKDLHHLKIQATWDRLMFDLFKVYLTPTCPLYKLSTDIFSKLVRFPNKAWSPISSVCLARLAPRLEGGVVLYIWKGHVDWNGRKKQPMDDPSWNFSICDVTLMLNLITLQYDPGSEPEAAATKPCEMSFW